MALVPDDLNSLKYIELQHVAKQCGVKANMKVSDRRDVLSGVPQADVRLAIFVGRYYRTIISSDKSR